MARRKPGRGVRLRTTKPVQYAIIGLCLVAMLFVGQLISAQKKKPPPVSPHQFWAVALAQPPSTRTLPVTRPSGQLDLHTVDGRLVYPAYRPGSVTVVGDLPSQREAQSLLSRISSAKRLGARVICVGTVAWCRGATV